MVVFTDLSEVLIHGIYGMEDIVARDHGAEVSKRFWERHDEVNDKILELFRDNCKEDDYWQAILEDGSLPFSLNYIKHVLSENIQRVIPGTLDVYKSITSHPRSVSINGVPSGDRLSGRPDIYIVSDHIKERLGQLKRAHPDLFDAVAGAYWSCDIGKIKGDPDFFPTVLSVSNLPAEKIVFVDDIERNVDSARKSGIYSILFKDADQLKLDFEKIGFRFDSRGL